ncbi:MAG: 30S ribosomal protein S12 methylthiotransferase RimO [Ruminococcus sp.]|nr:30S ribosomal protein S12 methylthiotransferase RimO [Ruminococcus sp.]
MNFKVGMVSLGCEKNRVDAEMLMYSLREHGYQLVEDVADADVAIVNTCGFIESAKQESIDEIIELGKLKAEGKIKKIIVTGCLAQRYKQEIMENLFEVDAVAGIGANQNIAEIVEQTLKDEKPEAFPDKLLLPLDGKRIQSTPFYYSYIKIAEGCSNCCSYCAIPLIRGKFRSREIENILQEAKGLAENGVKELIVIAQDTTKYGSDIYGEPSLAKLLKELCKIDGLKWIRVLYCYPENLTDELIDTIANEEKIVKYIDLPMQHCSKAVLEKMNRKGNMETLREKVNKLRSKIPDITIRTTFITGFPGETEEDFNELALFAKEMKFQRLGCFAYSQEENTKAALMAEQIDDEIKQKRADIIMEQQQLIMEEYCKSLEGKTIEVLFEGYDRYAECYFGRSQADAPEVDGLVFFTINGEKPQVGDFVKVKITDHLGCDPVGEMIY